MKFQFSAEIKSPSYRSVFHLFAREIGGETQFYKGSVITCYEGDQEDETFKKLLELYEKEPKHSITILTN